MRTNIDIDDKLLAQAMKVLKTKTKRATVERALRESLVRRSNQKLLALRGSVQFVPGYDPKTLER